MGCDRTKQRGSAYGVGDGNRRDQHDGQQSRSRGKKLGHLGVEKKSEIEYEMEQRTMVRLAEERPPRRRQGNVLYILQIQFATALQRERLI